MSLADVFASNAIVRWLRGDPNRYDLLTRMVGVRLGDRLLACGSGDPAMVAALARVTGLSGQAVAHAASADDLARLTAAAEHAGVLVDVVESPPTRLPGEDGAFDIVLVDAVSAPPAPILADVRRVLRVGGRVVVVIRQQAANAPAPADVLAATSAHFKGARILLERDGYALVEALKGVATPPLA